MYPHSCALIPPSHPPAPVPHGAAFVEGGCLPGFNGIKRFGLWEVGFISGLRALCPPVLGKQKDSEQMSFVHLSDCDWSLDILVYFSSIVVCTRRVYLDADWFG
ncbi:hypothetical protein TNIN_417091 [Trichonephila inaurata madagascariensis]|uniref:Uncharacterized protein n=1 Tax=Trichonephila inaurata madagascariensis TaxID=2747483 RepID=A0A8X6Y177_9ARAC|nr:hypothetical protein TNIN_417091 [Trichonephila inaurata madagascariensis]